MSWVNKFGQHSSALNQMSFLVFPSVQELVFSCRDGELSVCVVFNSIEALTDIIGSVPSEISSASTNRYGVDLESVGTSKLRLYCDGQTDSEMLRSYAYSASRSLIESKIYKRSDGEYPILIDRYNAFNDLISADEPEYSGDSSLLTGPAEIIDTASGHDVIYLAKVNADQCYMRVIK
jgi:hypothetical protein